MTPRADVGADIAENRLYFSVWQDQGKPVMSLLCREPCLPNVPKPYGTDSESYRSDHVREVAPHLWEATMRADKAKPFTLRFDLRGKQPAIDFDDRRNELRKLTFQDAGYHLDERDAEHEPMLFTSDDGHEFLVRPAPGGDDTFLDLVPTSAAVQTVRSGNWRYELVPEDPDEAGSYFAVLHGELQLADGDATVDLDIVRSPESDIGMWLTREGKPRVRFWQTNDANTHRFEACTSAASGRRCQVLYLAWAEARATCAGAASPGSLVIWFDLAGGYRAFTSDGDKLRDAGCNVAYAFEYLPDNKFVMKDLSGKAVEFAATPGSR